MKDHYKFLEADDCFDMGSEWLERKEFAKAEELLKKAIELNPNFIYSYITLALSMARQKKFGDAVSVLKHASRVDPEFSILFFLMAKYSFKRGDFAAALKFISRAYDMDPSKLHRMAKDVIEKYAAAYR